MHASKASRVYVIAADKIVIVQAGARANIGEGRGGEGKGGAPPSGGGGGGGCTKMTPVCYWYKRLNLSTSEPLTNLMTVRMDR